MAKAKQNANEKVTSAWAWMLLGVMLGFALFSLSFVFIPEEDRQFALRATDPSLATLNVPPAAVHDSVAQTELRYPLELSRPKPAPAKPFDATPPAATAAAKMDLDANPKVFDSKGDPKGDPMLPEPKKSVTPVTSVVTPATANAMAKGPAIKPEPTQTSGKTGLILQAGAFRDFEQAQRLKADLTRLGLPSYVQTAQVRSHTYHRVRLGPFASKKSMQAAQEKLRSRHIETIAMQVP